jgi:hypothetical protein
MKVYPVEVLFALIMASTLSATGMWVDIIMREKKEKQR